MGNNWVEDVLSLNEASKKLLTSAYFCRKVRPGCLTSKTMEGLLKTIVKKFPSLDSSSVTKHKDLPVNALVCLENLSFFYDFFVLMANMKEMLIKLTEGCDKRIYNLSTKTGCDILLLFLETMSNYSCSCFLYNKIDAKKTIVGLYAASYRYVNNIEEPSFKIVADLIDDYTNIWRRTGSDFLMFSSKYEIMVHSIIMELKAKCLESDQIVNGVWYSILGSAHELAIPPLYTFPILQIIPLHKLFQWIYFSSWLFSGSIINSNDVQNALYLVLTNYSVMNVYKDEWIYPHKEIASIIDFHKNCSKYLKTIQEYSSNLGTLATSHKRKRENLKYILAETIPLVKDQPGILGPKYFQLLTLLNIVFSEIEFYLIHLLPDSVKLTKKKSEDQFIIDVELVQILFYAIELRQLFITYAHVTQSYFYNFLVSFDLKAVEHTTSRLKLTKDENSCCSNIISAISKLPSLESGTLKILNTHEIFLNWLVFQSISCEINAKITMGNSAEFLGYFHNLGIHARIAHDPIYFLQQQCSLIPILFQARILDFLFSEALLYPGLYQFVLGIPKAYSLISLETSSIHPKEVQIYFDFFCSLIHKMLVEFSRKFYNHFIGFMKIFLIRASKYGSQNTSISWLNSVLNDEQLRKLTIPNTFDHVNDCFKKLKSTVFDTSNEISDIYCLYEMVNAISVTSSISIENISFISAMYLYPQIELSLHQTLNTLPLPSQDCSEFALEINKPSLVLDYVSALFEGVSLLGDFVNCDFSNLFASILLQQGTLEDLTEETSAYLTFTTQYSLWYTDDFFNRRFKSEGLIYSPVRNCFVVKVTSSLHMDEYTDLNEMEALASLVGPFGILSLCNQISLQCIGFLDEILKILIASSNLIISVKEHLLIEGFFLDDFFKKMKGIDELCDLLMQLGTALTLRKLMIGGLERCQESHGNFIDKAVNVFYRRNKGNSYELDTIGVRNQINEDFFLLMKTSTCFSDSNREMWLDLFPVTLSLLVPYLASKDGTEFLSLLGGFQNNTHVISLAVYNLIPVILRCFNVADNNEIVNFFHNFHRKLSLLCMKMYSGNLFQSTIKNKETIFIMYDMMMQDFKELGVKGVATDIIPYTMISHCYTNQFLLSKQRKKNKKQGADLVIGTATTAED